MDNGQVIIKFVLNCVGYVPGSKYNVVFVCGTEQACDTAEDRELNGQSTVPV